MYSMEEKMRAGVQRLKTASGIRDVISTFERETRSDRLRERRDSELGITTRPAAVTSGFVGEIKEIVD